MERYHEGMMLEKGRIRYILLYKVGFIYHTKRNGEREHELILRELYKFAKYKQIGIFRKSGKETRIIPLSRLKTHFLRVKLKR